MSLALRRGCPLGRVTGFFVAQARRKHCDILPSHRMLTTDVRVWKYVYVDVLCTVQCFIERGIADSLVTLDMLCPLFKEPEAPTRRSVVA